MNHESNPKPQALDSLTNNHNYNLDSDFSSFHQFNPLPNHNSSLDLGSGFSNDFDYSELQDNEEEEERELEFRFGFSSEPVNSHSDELHIIDLNYANDNEENNMGLVDNDLGFSLFEELDWEEVENRENLTAIIDELIDDEDSMLDLEQVIDLEIGLDMVVTDPILEDQVDENDNSSDFYLDDDDEFLYLAQFVDENNIILPATKRVVKNLPTMEIWNGGGVGCAICKEDIRIGEKVRGLPCGHYYHGECIGPWLIIRNTCPICRYELPSATVTGD